MIDTIVFSGGGIKIIYYIGVLKYLEENKLNENIDTYIGTSCGAIFSLLMSLGFTSDELIKIFNNIQLDNIINIDILSYIDKYGLCESDKIINIISIILKNKLNINDPYNLTFKDLYDKNKKCITIIGTNLTDNKIDDFNYINNPNMYILDAIKISINIPLFFNKIIYNNKIYIDGGILNHYPINFTKDINKTLGICFYNNKDEIINIKSYLLSILNIFYNKEIENISNEYKKNTIFINSNLNPIQFNIDKNELLKHINKGYSLTKKFITNHILFKKLLNLDNQ